MAVPTDGTATLAATDHRTEHARLVTRETTDLPRGFVALKYCNVTPAIDNTYKEICRLSNVPVVSGRLYLFSMYWRAITSSASSPNYVSFKTPETPNPVAGTTDLVIDALTFHSGAVTYGHLQWQQMFRAPTGNITIIIQIQLMPYIATGNVWLGDLEGNANFSVRDIGPNRGGQ